MQMSNSSVTAGGGGRAAGFTLIEIIIVVVIVSILSAVALPAFQESMNKGRRSEAKAGLMDAANRQERLMLDRSTYTTDLDDLGFTLDPNDLMVTEEGHYGITAAACAGGTIATCYMLTATPLASSPQAADSRCTQFNLDSTGAKTAEGSTASECW